MTQRHMKSIIPQKGGVSPINNETVFYAPYQEHLGDVIRGVKPIGKEYARNFDGLTNLITMNRSSPRGAFTVECWAKRNVTQNFSRSFVTIMGWRYITEALASIQLYSGNTIRYHDYGGLHLNSGVVMQADKWYHIAVSYDGTTAKVYVDGVMKIERVGAMSSFTSTEFQIGGTMWDKSGDTRSFAGDISNCKLWDFALSEQQILNSMNDSHIGIAPSAHWTLSEIEGNIAYDNSPNGNDLVIDGASIVRGPLQYSTIVQNDINGGVLVEEATSNIVTGTGLNFENGWTNYSGASVIKTQGVGVPEWNTRAATRLQITGGTHNIKTLYSSLSHGSIAEGRRFAVQIKVKNIGEKNAVLSSNRGATNLTSLEVPPGESRLVMWVTNSYPLGSGGNMQIQIKTKTPEDELDIIVFEPQIEEKTYHTSFTNGDRPESFLAYPNPIRTESPFTISLWAKRASARGTYETLASIDKGVSMNAAVLDIYNSSTLRFFTYNASGDLSSTTKDVPVNFVNNWFHIVGVYTGSKNILYVNGVNVNESTATGIIHTDGMLRIGHRTDRAGQNGNVFIDDLRIDKTAKTPEEIRAWYYQGRNG